jgi:uncharacterized protein (TIGR00730 family)
MKELKFQKAYDNACFMHSREARTLRILAEYLEPEKRFHDLNVFHSVVFFGSARIKPNQKDRHDLKKYYKAADEFAYRLALFSRELEKDTGSGFYVCTGGGPGIMEAANRGASRAKDLTIGLNISLPFEQHPNRYISPELNFEFHYFFMRKLWFLHHARAIVVFPGGYGTLDELFETLTLVQTRKLDNTDIPILLYDTCFWKDSLTSTSWSITG